MKSVIGICNLHDAPSLGSLTDNRPLAATTFLGRYGLMDFTLSNFSNSGIDRVFVLIESRMHAIKKHVQDGLVWVNNTKTGFQKLLLNEKGLENRILNTDIRNIKVNRSSFKEVKSDYVVIAPTFFLTSMDYRPIINEHAASGKDATVVYVKVKDKTDFVNCDTVILKEDEVVSFGKCTKNKQSENVSLEMFVINRDVFDRIIEESESVSEMYSLRKMIAYLLEEKQITVHGYEYKGLVVPMTSFEAYVKYSFFFLSYLNRQKLFDEDWPIYTTTHNTPPSLYGKKADVKNSFVANGSVINGKVENSIISRDVTVEEGAEVKNCIVFSRSEIGKNVVIHNCVLDKDVSIRKEKSVNENNDTPVFIPQGAKL